MMPLRMCGIGSTTSKSARLVSTGFAALLALSALGMRPVQDAATGKSADTQPSPTWVSISDDVLKTLTDAGRKIGYPGVQAGWYGTLVHYDVQGNERWSHHTPLRIEATEKTQVISDGRGGAILAAAEASKAGQSVLFFHYDTDGTLVRQWRYPASGDAKVAFVRMCSPSRGLLVACGKIVHEKRSTAEGNSDWVTLCYDMDGNLRWEKFCDGPMHGSDAPSAIGYDRDGDVFVAGVFSIGHIDDGTAALCPAVVKYSPDGQSQWVRWYAPLKGDLEVFNLTVANDGSSVTLAGKALTLERCFGAFALAFSGNGVLIQMHRNQMPSGYRSSVARAAYLMDDNRLLMVEDISPLPAEKFLEKTEMALNWSDMEGQDRTLYAYPRQKRKGGWVIPRATLKNLDSVFTCGRIPLSDQESAFMVVSFPHSLP